MSNDFNIYIRVLIVMIAFIAIAIGFVFAFIKYQKKIITKQKELHQLDSQHKQDLLTNTIHSAETERVRIAKELHDEVGSILSTLSMSISQVKNENPTDTKHITNSKKLIQDSINSVRRISRGIAPYELELLGLEKTLKNHFDTITSASEIQINFKNTFELDRLNYQTALAIYRISQELTSNCIKYANASAIDFLISENAEAQLLKINYADNGIGQDFETRKFSKGIGLKNIESRSIAMKGTCSFSTASPNGFACEIIVPMQSHILNDRTA
jgi:two-component system, NarL family, sensor kinase